MHKNKSANRNLANYRLYHALMEALIEDENAMDKEVADKGESTKRRRHDSSASGSAQPPSKDSNQSTKNKLDSNASVAQQPPAHTSLAWQITDIRDTPPDPSMQRSDHQSEQSSDDNPITDERHVSDPKDTDNAHIPKVPAATWFKPIPEEEIPATPEQEWTIPSNDYPEPENNWENIYATTYQDPEENKLQRKTSDIGSFIKWFYKRTGKKLCKADLEGPTFNLVKAFHNNSVSLQFQMDECHKLLTDKVDLVNPEGHQILRNVYEPLPLGGPPGQVTIQPQLFFNKDLEYLLSGDKEQKTALSISKLKAARYLDFGLEELVPYLWVKNRDAVRSHMRILSVISIKTYERRRYNYLREIVLCRADYKEYKISKKDFKNLHLNDFKDLNIVIRKRVEDLQLGVESYQTKLNLEQPNWDASDFLFKEDYTIVNKPKEVIYRDRDNNKKMMRIDEVHKFSDGTLMRI
ncbi:hypothetical protein Tco_0457749 [Tanacetum coccineum]